MAGLGAQHADAQDPGTEAGSRQALTGPRVAPDRRGWFAAAYRRRIQKLPPPYPAPSGFASPAMTSPG
jgi:hypothetical protein